MSTTNRRKLGVAAIAIAFFAMIFFLPALIIGAGVAIAGLIAGKSDNSRTALWLNIVGLALNLLGFVFLLWATRIVLLGV